MTGFLAKIPPGVRRVVRSTQRLVRPRVLWSAAVAVLDLIHPPTCVACRLPIRTRCESEEICDGCSRRIRTLPSCRRCGKGDASADGCPLCRDSDPGVRIRTFAFHDGTVRDLLIAAKWNSNSSVVPLLARWLLEAARDDDWHSGLETWVAVPRDRLRELLHGVPMAEEMGRRVGPQLGLRPVGRLHRRRRPPQARLTGRARRENLRDTVSVKRRAKRRVQGRRVLLIDDVITTGSTLRECARALHAAGAVEVRALTLAFRP